MKILVLRFSSIGDIVLTTPVIRCLRNQLPGAEIHVAVKASMREVLEANPNLDRLHLLESNLSDLIRLWKQEKFDYLVDLHHNLRTLRIKLALGVPSAAFPKLNLEKWLLVNLKINRLPNRHIVERYLEAVRPLGIVPDEGGLDFFPLPGTSKPSLPENLSGGYLAFAIGAQHGTKRLPVHRVAEAIQKYGKPVVLLGGKEDRARAELVCQLLPPGFPVWNGCGICTLSQSALLVRDSEWVCTNDTGLMHIAAAFGKKIVSFWGSTVPELGMYPYRTEHQLAEVKGLPCRPCSKIGFDTCPKKHFRCMEELAIPQGF